MSGRQFRLLEDHDTDCGALNAVADGRWVSPWVLNVMGRCDVEWLTAYGTDGGPKRRGCRFRWHHLVCNDPSCAARAIVRDDVFDRAIAEATDG